MFRRLYWETLVMAYRRGGFSPSAPRRLTLLVSLALVVVSVASLRVHLPMGQGFVAAHRFWLALAGYALLVLGVLLPRL